MQNTKTTNAMFETEKPFEEKLVLLGKFLEEEGYEVGFFRDSALRVTDKNGSFLITSRDGTKICLCSDFDVIDLAAPDSFQRILKTIKYCKETWAKDNDGEKRCERCPLIMK